MQVHTYHLFTYASFIKESRQLVIRHYTYDLRVNVGGGDGGGGGGGGRINLEQLFQAIILKLTN